MNELLASSRSLEQLLIALGLLLLVSILASKASGRLGVPALVLFLGIGMAAGSEGLGGIEFTNASLAQSLGVVALAFILYAGGLETEWKFVRRFALRSAILATIGVGLTCAILAWFVTVFLGWSWSAALLLAAIVSSTDAAAVFSILRARGMHLREDVAATLELESGSNDPMAVFLTTTFLGWIVAGDASIADAGIEFVRQMLLGALFGVFAGWLAARVINRLQLAYGGLYPVFTIATVILTYSISQSIGGNGFLSVYVCGIAMANNNFAQRRSLTRFHDGIAWLMQIAMFLTLGLLVFPSQLLPVAATSLAVALFLMFVARPVAVLISTAGVKTDWGGRSMMAWVGLRGAVPIILATFPLLVGVPQAVQIFHIVFFVVLTSVIVQGTSLPFMARALGVHDPSARQTSGSSVALPSRPLSELATLEVGDGSRVAGHRIVEIDDWPRDSLILVLYRGNEFFVPDGSSRLEPGDRLIVLTSKSTIGFLRESVEPMS